MTTQATDQDEIYRSRRERIVDFAFDADVAAVFSDMIRRSVPGYETVIPMSGLIAARHAQPGSRIYDLGCSLGATTLAVVEHLDDTDCRIVAVDNSAPMLDKARAARNWDPRVSFELADARSVDIADASVVLMNYLLQFVPADERATLLTRIHAGLRDGGALILSEKLAGDEWFDSLHADFKRANGYSDLEISQKRTALENVMTPDTLETHIARLRDAGFGHVTVWYRCLNWASLIAVKSADG